MESKKKIKYLNEGFLMIFFFEMITYVTGNQSTELSMISFNLR